MWDLPSDNRLEKLRWLIDMYVKTLARWGFDGSTMVMLIDREWITVRLVPVVWDRLESHDEVHAHWPKVTDVLYFLRHTSLSETSNGIILFSSFMVCFDAVIFSCHTTLNIWKNGWPGHPPDLKGLSERKIPEFSCVGLVVMWIKI